MRRREKTWTEERTYIAAEMWSEGNSASKIADYLNQRFCMRITRNAVIGKVHRLGKMYRAPSAGKRTSRSPRSINRGQVIRVGSKVKRRVVAAIANMHQWPIPPSEGMAAITDIMDLEDHHCRWPVGDPLHSDFGYCGSEAVKGMPYCLHHCRKAHPQVSKEEDKEADKNVEMVKA